MKKLSKLVALILSLCLVLSVSVFAAAAGTYTDGENSIEVFEDGTFVMTKAGADLDGNPFQLTVKGTIDDEGNMAITELTDGQIDLTEMASEEQKAGDLATAQALYEAMNAEGGEEESEGVKPGTYTNGTSTMEIAEDMTFVMTTPGQNLDGAEFALTVKGTIGEDGAITITGVFDGDIDLTEMASEEQMAKDTATAEAIYAIALEESKAGGEEESALEVAEDGSFVTKAKTINMAGDEIEVTITGKIDETGEVILESIVDGPMDLTNIIDEKFKEEQIANIKAQLEKDEPAK